ncbi:hypothetical protein ACTXT7_002215 [Hymenolepis weldensis]
MGIAPQINQFRYICLKADFIYTERSQTLKQSRSTRQKTMITTQAWFQDKYRPLPSVTLEAMDLLTKSILQNSVLIRWTKQKQSTNCFLLLDY